MVLTRFSDDVNITDDLIGQNIHRLENILTLDGGIHPTFGSLELWLEPTVGDFYCNPARVSQSYSFGISQTRIHLALMCAGC
jgi:hypothetical protein